MTGSIAQGWTLNVTVNDIVTAANANVGGRVSGSNGRPISKANVQVVSSSGETQHALTNPFGYFTFNGGPTGQTYVISVTAKGYQPRNVVRTVIEDVTDLEVVLQE